MNNTIEFIKSISSAKDALNDKKTFLIMGRSNVGKSSFINYVFNRINIARVSSTPGKTISFNYFLVDNLFYLIDSPGYGYAKRSKAKIEEFKIMLNTFISSVKFDCVILLIDFKVGPTNDDLMYYNLLSKLGLNIKIVCTKYDQVISSKKESRKKDIISKLNNSELLFISSTKKIGREQIIKLFYDTIE